MPKETSDKTASESAPVTDLMAQAPAQTLVSEGGTEGALARKVILGTDSIPCASALLSTRTAHTLVTIVVPLALSSVTVLYVSENQGTLSLRVRYVKN